jgi:hypothetical protein
MQVNKFRPDIPIDETMLKNGVQIPNSLSEEGKCFFVSKDGGVRKQKDYTIVFDLRLVSLTHSFVFQKPKD